MKKVNQPKEETLVNFKKARGSVDSIIKMLEKDEYCVDIMQQNLAVIGLLKSAHEKLMNNHLETCFTKGMDSTSDTKKKKMIAEIETLIKMGNR